MRDECTIYLGSEVFGRVHQTALIAAKDAFRALARQALLCMYYGFKLSIHGRK
jgi:hypothetical protein